MLTIDCINCTLNAMGDLILTNMFRHKSQYICVNKFVLYLKQEFKFKLNSNLKNKFISYFKKN